MNVLQKVHEIISAGWVQGWYSAYRRDPQSGNAEHRNFSSKEVNCHCLSGAVYRAHGAIELYRIKWADQQKVYGTFEFLVEAMRELHPSMFSSPRDIKGPSAETCCIAFNDSQNKAAVLQLIEHAIKMEEFLSRRPQPQPTPCPENPSSSQT